MLPRLVLRPRLPCLALSVVCLIAVQNRRAVGGTVHLVLPDGAAAPLKFGAGALRAALEDKGQVVRQTAQSVAAGLRIYVAERGSSILGEFKDRRLATPDAPESYSVTSLGDDRVVVEGSDATGAMYGALDLAEQIDWAPETDFVARLQPVSKSPFNAVRGINKFLTVQGFAEPDSWYWSDSYWAEFLGMMARHRYNFLDLHGPHDLICSLPDGYSFFVSLPDYPEVGVGPERAAKNMKRFQQIIRMAADHGVKVGYMNYKVAPTIGPWQSGRYGEVPRGFRKVEGYLDDSKVADYTRKATVAFLEQMPDLWMFGFRIGESGRPEDFFDKTYLEAIRRFPKKLNIYCRTWHANPIKVRELGAATEHQLYIEPKYNGEHLGPPYHAVIGARSYIPSGSYEDYTNYPRDYKIIWQIRANGTLRIFLWGWPEFARRMMRSCKFGGAAGFSMEPMTAYYPEWNYIHNNPATSKDYDYFEWMFQRHWFWYMVWGRTAYDPEVSDRVWLTAFERRFGAKVGPHVYEGLVSSSKIVPFVFSYHNVGLDHQHMAPEYEVGQVGRHRVPSQPWKEFLGYGVIDRTAMADPLRYVDSYLKGETDGRMTPFEAADYLETAAEAALAAMQKVDAIDAADKINEMDPRSQKELASTRMDIEAVAALGRYYAERIRSVTHLQFYRRTGHRPELTAARDYVERAIAEWDRLADVTEKHYGPVSELVRMRSYKFSWREQGKRLLPDLAEFDRMAKKSRPDTFEWPYRNNTVLGHVPPRKVKPGRAVPIEVTTLPRGKWFDSDTEQTPVFVFYRPHGQKAFTRLALEPKDAYVWKGEIPAAAVMPGKLEYYFESAHFRDPYGGTLYDRPPYAVLVNEDDTPPRITHTPPEGVVRGNQVTLGVGVEDDAEVSRVHVYYKRMPAYYGWLKLAMDRVEGRDLYYAEVPLTPEGILYYFEASDVHGNAVNHPHFLRQTPYFVVDSWDPGEK